MARPGYIAPVAYVHPHPVAVSHQSHVQIHGHPIVHHVVKPIVPLVHHPIVHAPVMHAHHVVAHPYLIHG